MSKYNRLNRLEMKLQHQQTLERKLKGEGLYEFQNRSTGEFMLPKPAADGRRRIPGHGKFEGDSYFMQYVKSNHLILIKEITSIDQQRKDKIMNEQKLILEQPTRVTTAGKTEQVQLPPPGQPAPKPSKAEKKVNEAAKQPAAPPPDVLLNENPVDGIEFPNA